MIVVRIMSDGYLVLTFLVTYDASQIIMVVDITHAVLTFCQIQYQTVIRTFWSDTFIVRYHVKSKHTTLF